MCFYFCKVSFELFRKWCKLLHATIFVLEFCNLQACIWFEFHRNSNTHSSGENNCIKCISCRYHRHDIWLLKAFKSVHSKPIISWSTNNIFVLNVYIVYTSFRTMWLYRFWTIFFYLGYNTHDQFCSIANVRLDRFNRVSIAFPWLLSYLDWMMIERDWKE